MVTDYRSEHDSLYMSTKWKQWQEILYRQAIGFFKAADPFPYPRFIIRASDLKIFDLDNNPDILKDVKTNGYGIISYTWGAFQDRNKAETSGAITFDDSIPKSLRWYIPQFLKKDGKGFEFQQLRAIIQNIPEKYIWWDLTCIPQSWESLDGTLKFRPQDPSYERIKQGEIAKQSSTYARANKGVIWLHGTEWTTNEAKKGSLQKLLELDNTELIGIAKILELLERIKDEEPWFGSVWTFQEGILLDADNVIDPTNAASLHRREADFYAELRDKNETGFVSYMAGSPLSILQAAKARGNLKYTSEADYCVNAVLGGLQMMLPVEVMVKPLLVKKLALFSALVDRHSWSMLLMTKPTRGNFTSQAMKSGQGDWLSILDVKWNWTDLSPFISTTLGMSMPQNDFPSVTRFVIPGNGLISGGTPRRRINLPSIVHCYSEDPASTVDSLIIRPKQQLFKDQDLAYSIYVYGPAAGNYQAKPWSTGRFYASEENQNPQRKMSRCVMKFMTSEEALKLFGPSLALVPLEDVSFLDSSTPDGPVYTRCAIFSNFQTGAGQDAGLAGAVFGGIGDFIFPKDGGDIPVQVLLGKSEWELRLY
ncbi:hypothetical protein BKA66DRAFT_437185 [Pyrenochaeta sp. MPI-SDFR-AT-0127]|nr:hypothetical protein BKA66DRAFT_437185 [Pyrenochaeta sp. MPI-SDFR-AT-0127]